jgi:hypothetical protein
MTLPQFHTAALLQHDLRQLGHDCDMDALTSEVPAKNNLARRAALAFLATVVDPAVAPLSTDPPVALDDFWAALGLPALEPPPPDAAPRVRRAHAAATAASLRTAVDLAFGARSVEHSDVVGAVEEDEEECAARTRVIGQLYDVFPRAVPTFDEPKYKPKRKRPPGAVGAPVLGRGHPVEARTSSAASAARVGNTNAAAARRVPLSVLNLVSGANVEAPKAAEERGTCVPAIAAGSDDLDVVCCDGGVSVGDQRTKLDDGEEDAAHEALLSSHRVDHPSQGTSPNVDEIGKLAAACNAAVAAGEVYRLAAEEALALSATVPPRPPRDMDAEALLAAELKPAIEAHEAVSESLRNIRRSRDAYSRIASAARDVAPCASCEQSAAASRLAARRADRYSSTLLRSIKLRGIARPQALGRSVHLPAGELRAVQ